MPAEPLPKDIPPETTRIEWTLDQLRKKIQNKTLRVEVADELFATVNKEQFLNDMMGKDYAIFHRLTKPRHVYIQVKYYYGRNTKS